MQLYEIIGIATPFIGTGIAISLFIGVAFYMASKILNDVVIANKGKEFLMSSLETIAIVFGFILISYFLDMMFSSMMGCSSTCSPLPFAEIALTRMMDTVVNLYMTFYLFDLFVGPFLQSTISTGYAALGTVTPQLTFMPLIGLDIVMEFYYMIMQRIFDILLFVLLRIGLIQITVPLIAYLFPLAVIFRAIPITKRVGSSLFAIVIVLYYVFPLSVLFSDYLVYNEYRTDLIANKNYNTDITEGSTYIKEGETTNFQTPNDPTIIETQLNEQLRNTELSINSTPQYEYTIGEAIRNVKGAPLGEISGKAKTFLFTTFSSAIAGFLLNFPAFGWTFLITRIAGLFFYVSYIQGMLMTLSPYEWLASLFNALLVLASLTAQIAVVIFITLIMEIVISITAYRAIAKMLKGDVSMLGLTRVI